jgi:hypothetical protein
MIFANASGKAQGISRPWQLLLILVVSLAAPLLTGFVSTVSATGERYRYLDANTIEVTGPDIEGATILRIQPGTNNFVGDIVDKRNGCTWALTLDVDDANPERGTLAAPAFVYCIGPDAAVLDNWDRNFIIAPIGSQSGTGGQSVIPICAVVGYGQIPCPVRASIPADGRCYVQDPATDRDFKRVECNHPAFTPAAIDCNENAGRPNCDPATVCNGDQCDLVRKYVNPLIALFSALVGIGVTLAIVWSGIQYSKSANDSRTVAEAKRRILVALLVLIGYFLFYRLISWLVPGGLGT